MLITMADDVFSGRTRIAFIEKQTNLVTIESTYMSLVRCRQKLHCVETLVKRRCPSEDDLRNVDDTISMMGRRETERRPLVNVEDSLPMSREVSVMFRTFHERTW